MKHVKALAVAIALVGLGALTPAQAANKTVRYVYPPVADMWPFFVAKTQGFFEKRGIDMQLQAVGVSSNAPAALISGSADLAFITLPTLLPAIENGLDLVVVGGAVVADDTMVTSIMTKPDSAISKPKDLEGKKVGVPGIGAFVNVLINEWLSKNDVDYKKVTYVEVPFPQMMDTLRAGNVDAVAPVEPFVTRIKTADVGVPKFPYARQVGKDYRIGVTVASRKFATENPDVIKGVKEALAEAEAFRKTNEKETRAAIGEFIKLPPPVIAGITLTNSPAKVSDQEIDDWSSIMVKQGLLQKPVEGSKINIK